MIIRATALALLAAPAWAQDGCPTAADLARGIAVTYDDGRRDLFRAGDRPEDPPGLVVLESTEADGSRYRLELAQGFHVVTWRYLGNDRTVAYEYGIPAEELAAPDPGGRRDGPVSDGDDARPLRRTDAYGPLGRLEVGGCAYDSIEALVVWHSSEYQPDPVLVVERSRYLPGLGLAVEVEQQIASDPPRTRTPTAIEAAP